MVGMYNWLCAMSILGCLFIAYIAFKISYLYYSNMIYFVS